jgi:hypothetical protein
MYVTSVPGGLQRFSTLTDVAEMVGFDEQMICDSSQSQPVSARDTASKRSSKSASSLLAITSNLPPTQNPSPTDLDLVSAPPFTPLV